MDCDQAKNGKIFCNKIISNHYLVKSIFEKKTIDKCDTHSLKKFSKVTNHKQIKMK